MSIVVLIQEAGVAGNDTAAGVLEQTLNDSAEIVSERAFERTIGDQVVGVLSDPTSLTGLLVALDEAPGDFTVAVGLGTLDRMGDSARDIGGPALRAAQTAEKRLDKSLAGIAVEGTFESAADVDSSVSLLADILGSRSERQREVVTLRRRNDTGEQIAGALTITRRAVHKHLTAARFPLEVEARRLVDRLTARAHAEATA